MSHDINTSNTGPMSATVSPAKLRILLSGGVIAGPLFVGVAALQALTRDGFDLSRRRLSLLSVATWTGFRSHFVVAGLLSTTFAVGMWLVLHPGRAGTWGAILRGVVGAGLVAGGVSSLIRAWLPSRGSGDARRGTPAFDVPYRRH